MKVKIFDVEHGACALITCPNGHSILIDCGFNSISEFRPSTYLPSIGVDNLEMLIISNYDEDHFDDLINLRKKLSIQRLLRNRSVSAEQLKKIKNETNPILSDNLLELCQMMNEYCYPSIFTDWGGLICDTFYNKYPTDFESSTNNLSVVNFISFNGLRMLFAGDLEKEGWEMLLKDNNFIEKLKNVNVFVASHHGRESGYCEEVFNHCHPKIIIISDRNKIHGTQETTNKYASKASGIKLLGVDRKVLTTRHDGAIQLEAAPEDFIVTTSKGLASVSKGLFAHILENA